MHFCFCLHLVCHLKIFRHKFCSQFFQCTYDIFTVCFSLFYIYNGPEFRKCWVASMTSCLSFSFVNSRQTVTRNFFNFDPNHPFSIQKIFPKNYKIHIFQDRTLNMNSASPKYRGTTLGLKLHPYIWLTMSSNFCADQMMHCYM